MVRRKKKKMKEEEGVKNEGGEGAMPVDFADVVKEEE